MVTTDGLLARLREGIGVAAGRGRRTLVSVTVPVEGIDPCAAVFVSRLASDRWFCWEQPDRKFALGALGVAHEAASRGDDRFAEVAEECLGTGRDAVIEEPSRLPAGAGPVWVGGFAFDPAGGASSTWSSFSPGSMVLPELSLCRSGEATFLTLNTIVSPGDEAAAKQLAGGAAVRTACRPASVTRPASRSRARRSAAPGRQASLNGRSMRRRP